MLVVRGDRPFADRGVRDLPEELDAGDLLVFNDTRVIPAQLFGTRGAARVGVTLHKREGPSHWRAFVRNARRLKSGDRIDFAEGFAALVGNREEDGSIGLELLSEEPVEAVLARHGT